MNFRLKVYPETAAFSVECGGRLWQTKDNAYILTASGEKLPFADHYVSCEPYRTGTLNGTRAHYDFDGLKIDTVIAIERDFVRCELHVFDEKQGQLNRVYWPAAIEFDIPEGRGYTVLPMMHGSLVPAKWDKPLCTRMLGLFDGRHGYLPFLGQIDDGRGWCAIWDDHEDAGYEHGHTPGGVTEPEPFWVTSLGRIGRRVMRYAFFDGNADYNTLAKCYRSFAKSAGSFVSLKEKIARNPNIEYLIGSPIFHTKMVCTHISPDSAFYDKEHPENNEKIIPFSEIEHQLNTLKQKGLEKIYMHMDGWGRHGYDNLHPDVFPPCEKAGGTEGMRKLSDAARALGYRFGIHDQYRDYYYDADSFDFNNAVHNIDGSTPFESTWYGGKQTMLCASLAPQYVRRNYDEFEQLGIRIDGSYLDVFSIVEGDECFHKDHPMTRRECFSYRGECFDELTSRGIITSSEETAEATLRYLALCHHSPLPCLDYEGEKLESAGIPIPLFSLVYHECIVIPWFGADMHKGGWSIPYTMCSYLYALMTGGTVYVDPEDDEATIERVKLACENHKKLWDKELVRHEFLEGYHKQRSTFSDGTTVTVDFDTNEYSIN